MSDIGAVRKRLEELAGLKGETADAIRLLLSELDRLKAELAHLHTITEWYEEKHRQRREQVYRLKAEVAAERARAKESEDRLILREEETDQLIEAAEARAERLEKAAALPRNTLIHDDPGFAGFWIAVPKEDFDALREALRPAAPSDKQDARGR